MNKEQLKIVLINKGIRQDMYYLNGGLPNEAYCLNQIGAKWEVYYSERGQKTNNNFFDSEDEACSYLFNLLVMEQGNLH